MVHNTSTELPHVAGLRVYRTTLPNGHSIDFYAHDYPEASAVAASVGSTAEFIA